ncbi:hypothetical protein N658DRAFT_500144 [Parathielavia hyrcaniae]|uniref:Uncharacterized protein n=1 Tax=Parathielavia hyrcaniae TaxID=113614 RepID=A0AAN6SY64_9PEZI|nr:hypothetical protein N658DRAFT_500144 [Parathielavia hyrcaniae]
MVAQQVHPQYPSVAAARLGGTDFVFYHGIEDKMIWVLTIDSTKPSRVQRRQILDPNSDGMYEGTTGFRPLAASTWEAENEVYMYYVGINRRLREVYTRDKGATWRVGKVDGLRIEVLDGSGLCATSTPDAAVYIVNRLNHITEARYDSGSDDYYPLEHS